MTHAQELVSDGRPAETSLNEVPDRYGAKGFPPPLSDRVENVELVRLGGSAARASESSAAGYEQRLPKQNVIAMNRATQGELRATTEIARALLYEFIFCFCFCNL